MTPKQFVDQQLARPEPDRTIPDRIYMWENRTDDIETLREGRNPLNANDAFVSAVYYENAEYFGPSGLGHRKYYPNGVFSI